MVVDKNIWTDYDDFEIFDDKIIMYHDKDTQGNPVPRWSSVLYTMHCTWLKPAGMK